MATSTEIITETASSTTAEIASTTAGFVEPMPEIVTETEILIEPIIETEVLIEPAEEPIIEPEPVVLPEPTPTEPILTE